MRVVLLLLAVAGAAHGQALYRCDAGGRTVYQQVPCPGGRVIATPPPPTVDDEWRGRVALAIARQRVMVGMTSDEVVRSWGRPQRVNRTVSGETVSEQWVYRESRDAQYLYLENGVLRAAQSSE